MQEGGDDVIERNNYSKGTPSIIKVKKQQQQQQ